MASPGRIRGDVPLYQSQQGDGHSLPRLFFHEISVRERRERGPDPRPAAKEPQTMQQPHRISELTAAVEERLRGFFREKKGQAQELSPRATELIGAIERLTMRGGKRLRPVVLYAGFRAVDPQGALSRVVEAAAGLELLQSYLLTHDDWMDRDDRRRGGPSVHADLRAGVSDRHLADSLAILCGDLACGFSWELFHNVPFPHGRRQEAMAEIGTMHREVIFGQQLDLLGDADVKLIHHLKTGSYTVRGPLRLGAILADSSRAELEALTLFGAPLGIAFQLRDDLLGIFGDSRRLGKQAGNDLRAGKNNAVVFEARNLLRGDELEALLQVLGNKRASARRVARVVELLRDSGAGERVRKRIQQMVEQARRELGKAPLRPEGAGLLLELIDRLVVRDH